MLDSHSRQQLSIIVQTHGHEIINQLAQCKRLLAELAPQQRLENNLLISALIEDVAQDLLMPSSLPLAAQFALLARRLHDNCGTREDFAYWAVESWALALQIIDQPLPQAAARQSYEPEMQRLTGGSFRVETDADPIEIQVDEFEISLHLITQAQWQAVMKHNPAHFKGDDLPIETVSFLDIEVFIQQLNTQTQQRYRLPTEAEWEYACRAGTDTRFYTGDTVHAAQANYDSDAAKEKTTPVGSYPPNPWGLFDMMGNVWEWTATPDDEARQRFIIRGGSWFDEVDKLQSAGRFAIAPDQLNFDLGFRLARDV